MLLLGCILISSLSSCIHHYMCLTMSLIFGDFQLVPNLTLSLLILSLLHNISEFSCQHCKSLGCWFFSDIILPNSLGLSPSASFMMLTLAIKLLVSCQKRYNTCVLCLIYSRKGKGDKLHLITVWKKST